MTVSSINTKNSYSANGSLTSFTYTFPINTTAELQVIERAANGSETVKTLNSDYSITDNGSQGGQVIFNSAPANGVTIVLLRDTNLTQETDYIANDPFPAETHEAALDKLTLQQQELQEELDRAIKISRSNDITSSEIVATASARAGKLLAFDSSGDLEVSLDASSIATNATAAANSATAAAASQTAAETAKTAAETAKTAAESLLDTFDDRFLGAKASDPTVDNDGDALQDASLYYDTTNDVMKVYDLSGTQWRQIQLSNADQTNVNLVAGQISPTNNISTLAAQNANLTTLAGLNSEITTLAGISGLSNLAANNAAITNVNNNLTSVNNFAETYRIGTSNPTTSLNVGDLFFNQTDNELKVYKSSGWSAAGSTINGTSARFNYTATAGQTTFSGSDTAGNNLAFDAGFADVYLNGVRLSAADVNITSGNSVVLLSGAASAGDVLDVVGYGTFNVAAIDASNISSGTINNARLPSTISDKTIEATALTAKGDGSSADGFITLNCSQNSHGVKIQSPAHSAAQSYTLILPTSVGTANQVLATNGNSTNQLTWIDAAETKPTVANVSQTIAPATATSINITGTNFSNIPQVEFIKSDTGAITQANSISLTNATTLAVNVTLASGTYYVRVELDDGNAARSTNAIITASTAPSFSTAAGSLGTFAGNFSGTVATIAGSSDSAITFSEVGSNLAGANVTLSSAGVLATTDFGGSSTTPTQYNFTIRITDQEGQTTDRAFSFTSSFGATGGGQFN
nr:tail fiber [uncultured Mediterranean phage uvMED]